MKLFLLKTLLQRRARDEGFTLPMVIALGLVMLLLGAINLTVSNEENLTAISQNSRSDALAIAEVGIARYRELLDRNRVLAINDHSLWGSLNQVCDDDIDSLLPSGSPPEPEWQTVVDSQDLDNDGNRTEPLGSYSLVSYEYNLTNGSNNFNKTDDARNVDGSGNSATGTLTVRGRAANESGEAQIEVDIPIRINLDDMGNLAPALWIGDNTVSAADLGNLTIGNGNLVIRDPAVTTGTTRDGCRNFAQNPNAITGDNSPNLASGITTTTGTVISDPRDIPSIDEVINNINRARTDHSVAVGNPINTHNINQPGAGQLLFGAKERVVTVAGTTTSVTNKPYNPDPSATNPTNCSSDIKLCRYYYDPPGTIGLTYTDTDLLTDGVAKTTLLLNQDLTISSTIDRLDDPTIGKYVDVKVGSTSKVDKDSNAFEIYVMDNDADPTNGSTNNITINADAGRIVAIHGFIHAPQSTLTITGDGTVNIFGSVWVNDFDNSDGTTVTISPDMVSRVPTASDPSTSGRGYKFYSTTNSRTARPITGSPTIWKTEQIN